MTQPRGTSRRPLSLALQGGGAFGAFTWGVLDRLLEEESLVLDCVSGSSAGAVNAALLAEGLRRDGRAGARICLDDFWTKLAKTARSSFIMASRRANMAFDVSSRVLSPYVLNPFNLNPLRDLLASSIDFPSLRADPPLRLVVGTTRVSDGSLRVFRETEIDLDVVLASACLPLIHHAVEIDGESYWDGGYAANPPLLQLVGASAADHVLLVRILPTTGDEHPTSSPDIVKRLNQITFNTPLQHDIDALMALKRLSDSGSTETAAGRKLSDLRLDQLSAEDWVPDLSRRSLLDLDTAFLLDLKAKGRMAGSHWLAGDAEPMR